MATRARMLTLVAGILFTGGLGCDSDGGTTVTRGDPDTAGGGDTRQGDFGPPAPYVTMAIEYDVIEVDDPTRPAGIQGKMLRGANGTFYYAYLKYSSDGSAECDIAVFAGGPAPSTNYDFKVAVIGPAGFSVETVDLSPAGRPFVMGRFGVDGVMDGNTPTWALAVGPGDQGSALGVCGSDNLTLVTRNGTDNYNVRSVASESGDCCVYPGECPDPACNSGTVVGPWAAIGLDSAGNMASAFIDYHNYWDEDGQTWQGLEFWSEAEGTFGVKPWSGEGRYGSLVYSGTTALLFAAHFRNAVFTVYRRTGAAGSAPSVVDWEPTTLANTHIGERASAAVAGDNTTIGVAYHDADANDLRYCQSDDAGATWNLPCPFVDQPNLNTGHFPSLAFDNESRPVIAYQHCGVGATCSGSTDELRLAWREHDGTWNRRTLVGQASAREGLYAALAINPDDNSFTVGYQDLTLGAAMVVRGNPQ